MNVSRGGGEQMERSCLGDSGRVKCDGKEKRRRRNTRRKGGEEEGGNGVNDNRTDRWKDGTEQDDRRTPNTSKYTEKKRPDTHQPHTHTPKAGVRLQASICSI